MGRVSGRFGVALALSTFLLVPVSWAQQDPSDVLGGGGGGTRDDDAAPVSPGDDSVSLPTEDDLSDGQQPASSTGASPTTSPAAPAPESSTGPPAIPEDGLPPEVTPARPVFDASNWADIKGPLRALWNAWRGEQRRNGVVWDDDGHVTNLDGAQVVSSFRADEVPQPAVQWITQRAGELLPEALVAGDAATRGLLLAGELGRASSEARQRQDFLEARDLGEGGPVEPDDADDEGSSGQEASGGDDSGAESGAGGGTDDSEEVPDLTGDDDGEQGRQDPGDQVASGGGAGTSPSGDGSTGGIGVPNGELPTGGGQIPPGASIDDLPPGVDPADLADLAGS